MSSPIVRIIGITQCPCRAQLPTHFTVVDTEVTSSQFEHFLYTDRLE